jgi:hypothetical protein
MLLRMKNVSDKRCRGNQDTHFMSNNFFPLENTAVLLDNVGGKKLCGAGQTT